MICHLRFPWSRMCRQYPPPQQVPARGYSDRAGGCACRTSTCTQKLDSTDIELRLDPFNSIHIHPAARPALSPPRLLRCGPHKSRRESGLAKRKFKTSRDGTPWHGENLVVPSLTRTVCWQLKLHVGIHTP